MVYADLTAETGSIFLTLGVLLSPDQVAKLANVSRRTIDRFSAMGQMPPKVPLGKKVVRFRTLDILRWMEEGCKPRRR